MIEPRLHPGSSPPRRAGARLWLLALVLLVAVDPILLWLCGWAAFQLLHAFLVFGGFTMAAGWAAGLRWPGSAPLRRDGFSAEEAAARKRLAEARGRALKTEQTLHDLESLRLSASEMIRARWAAVELQERLEADRRAMARERASLAQVACCRWRSGVEGLRDRLPEVSLRRLDALHAEGALLAAQLRADLPAAETSTGTATLQLLESGLQELEVLRAPRLPGKPE